MASLAASECPSGSLVGESGKNVLCQKTVGRGYAYKYYSEAKQGYALELSSRSAAGGRTWIVKWRLYDDGTIEPMVGSTGILEEFGNDADHGWILDSAGTVGIGASITYFWKLDLDLGDDPGNDRFQQLEVHANGSLQDLTITNVLSETAASVDPELKRSWRIVDSDQTNLDGHPISYHLEPLHSGHRYVGPSSEPWSANDIYATRYRACERFVSGNDPVCGDNVSAFVDGESIGGADIVIWYGLSFHHLPRGEEVPYIPTRWDGFQIVPRDWTADNPLAAVLVPGGRS